MPQSGIFEYEGGWNPKKMGSDDTVIDIAPDADGSFDLALHYAELNVERDDSYRPFEECVEESRQDFEDWLAMYPKVPSKYEYIKKISAYSVWICYVAPPGILKSSIVLFAKDNSALSWHQAYHAMAITNNVDTSVEIIRCIFDYQDEYGELPDLIDDQYCNILATKPPFQGFGFLYMLERYGDQITADHCKLLYEPFAKLYGWWTTLRDTDGDGVPQYNHGCEGGNDYTGMLKNGTPVECSDIISYIILMAESLSFMAAKLGKEEEAAQWDTKAKKLLWVLVTEFWNGRKFIARMSGSHEIVESDEIDIYMPLMLGKRLPKEIIDTLAQRLADPEIYYSPIGLRGSPKPPADAPPHRGFIMGFAQLKLALGLYMAGKEELARDLLRRYLDANLDNLPDFAYLEDAEPGKSISIGRCSALTGSMFMVMAGFLSEISRQD